MLEWRRHGSPQRPHDSLGADQQPANAISHIKEAIGQGSPVQAAFFAEHAAHAPSVSSKLLPKQRMEKAYCLLAKQMLIATGNFHGGGSPEGAVAQTWTFDSPLWAFFGYFLSQQKVTESLPQKRLKPRKKSSLLLKSRKTHPQFHPIFRQQPTKKPSAACICRASVL